VTQKNRKYKIPNVPATTTSPHLNTNYIHKA